MIHGQDKRLLNQDLRKTRSYAMAKDRKRRDQKNAKLVSRKSKILFKYTQVIVYFI